MNHRGFLLFFLAILVGCEQSSPPESPSSVAASDREAVAPAVVDTRSVPVHVAESEADEAKTPRKTKGQKLLARMQSVLDLSDEQSAQILSMMEVGAKNPALLTVLSDEQRAQWKAYVASRREQRKSPAEVVASWQATLDLEPAQVERIKNILAEGGNTRTLKAVLTPEQIKQLKHTRKQQKLDQAPDLSE
ncbi:hypothetical protein F2Q65_06895 [Thiohalocapsa marina]|uniref:Uncharacterized protein n=1 Tax=Thiohalocapsa marina TaxID=424902 RepID=A0A5M8FMW8_9GAMM|nr:hypothetical protein [Thiohalocapsa marina]KAA6186079.1 hypothetical protein F2Q65_06895 [Thiohalocapsa marina]